MFQAGFGHFGQAKVDRVGQDRRQQQNLVLRHFTAFQVREVTGKSGPRIDLQQQLGNFNVGQQHRRLIDQGLRGIGYRCVQRRDLETGCGDDGIG